MVGGPTGPAGPLLRRRDAKASAALSGSPSPADAADRGRFPVDRGIVRNLSDAQLALYRQCFPDGSGGINFPAFQRCFEQFSNGELRSSSPTLQKKGVREPNGGLLQELYRIADDAAKRAKGWPATAKAVGNALRRIAPNLWAVGVAVVFDREATTVGGS
jgi:hypothetical protein